MDDNNISVSEAKQIIDIIFNISDALFLCSNLSICKSSSHYKLAALLSESYTLANEMLLIDGMSPSEMRGLAAAKIGMC